MLGGIPGMDGMKEEMKKKAEEQVGEQAPGMLKPLFPLLGGPVATVEACMCLVPADKQEQAKQAIEKYKGM